jgi:hypothetical protein
MLVDVPANHVELLLLRNKSKVDVSHGIHLVIGVVNRSSRMSCPTARFQCNCFCHRGGAPKIQMGRHARPTVHGGPSGRRYSLPFSMNVARPNQAMRHWLARCRAA